MSIYHKPLFLFRSFSFYLTGGLIEKGVVRRFNEGFDGMSCPYIFTWSTERPNKVSIPLFKKKWERFHYISAFLIQFINTKRLGQWQVDVPHFTIPVSRELQIPEWIEILKTIPSRFTLPEILLREKNFFTLTFHSSGVLASKNSATLFTLMRSKHLHLFCYFW